ncbi:MAG: acetate--CoA ligase [Candidatus Omnitrophica bacterium CG11_big_fil_rev_8_21_14_0_20_63_9]|nr:MAG: acetate--CoA ligase [Candidatus Omnitrophica bacterium CG11_big_fil_rev_8_21_14_0_20_63_9]
MSAPSAGSPVPSPTETAVVEWERKPKSIDANLKDYDAVAKTFDWKTVEREFDWSKTGKVNLVHEAVDRHAVSSRGTKVALYYTDFERRSEEYTFQDFKKLTSRVAHVLKQLGVKKGDRVGTFLPRTPELYITILGIHRVGAIPVPLFEAFMEQAVEDRLSDSEAVLCVTSPALKSRIPRAKLPALKILLLVGASGTLESGEASYEQLIAKAPDWVEPEWLTVDDGLVIHYTSGSTGKSKGALHRQYAMVGHYQTAKWALDLRDDDVYWCTADPGWVTGTSYGIYGPWTLGITSVVIGGRFDPERWFETIQRYKVTMWYSAPTAYRMLMSAGETIPKKYDLKSLRHICSVGEPLNPEALKWIKKITGLAPHETWWMTETGMQLICNYRSYDFPIGCTGKPFPGTYATVVDDQGKEVAPGVLGNLVVKPGWPSMMKEIWRNAAKYQEYFRIPGWYASGDSAFKDERGYIWYQGRADDVIKTAGERVGPFEVESALVAHPAVAEAGVIGKPDAVRGQIIKAFVALRKGRQPSDQLKKEIADFVKTNLAAHAAPREIDFVEKVPKTRSGKIMRRVLRAWDQGLPVGDISTMEE